MFNESEDGVFYNGIGCKEIREHVKIFQAVGWFRVLGSASVHCGGCSDSVFFCCCYREDHFTSNLLLYSCWDCSCIYFSVLVIWVHSAFWEASENCHRPFQGTIILTLVNLRFFYRCGFEEPYDVYVMPLLF